MPAGMTRWAPIAAGIDQPIAWLSVGLKYVRGCVTRERLGREVLASPSRPTKSSASSGRSPPQGGDERSGSTPHFGCGMLGSCFARRRPCSSLDAGAQRASSAGRRS